MEAPPRATKAAKTHALTTPRLQHSQKGTYNVQQNHPREKRKERRTVVVTLIHLRMKFRLKATTETAIQTKSNGKKNRVNWKQRKCAYKSKSD